MSPREHKMAIAFLALILIGGGGIAGYMFVYSPLQEKKEAQLKLQGEVNDLETKVLTMVSNRRQVEEVKRQSLPPDESIAKAQYKLLLERLILQAKISNYTLPDGRMSVTARSTPEIAPKKPAYRTLTFQIDFKKVDIWQLADFLYFYYQLDLLQQITEIRINRENKVTDGRNGLDVHLTTEAIILDGVEQRVALFPVTSSVAAVAGIPGLQVVVAKPELARRLTTTSQSPVLATRQRDYSWLAQRDMFYGPIPPAIPPKSPEFRLERIETVMMDRNDRPKDVRIRLSGDGSVGAKIEAMATGTLLPEGPLAFDPKTQTLHIPAIESDASDYQYSTISVVATAANGKVTKGSFTVSPARLPPEPPKGPDIASAIRLVIVSTASDNTAYAMIKDNANPFRYTVMAKPSGIEIIKEWPATNKTWKRDRDYDQPPGVLLISDPETSTKRTFKIVSIEHNALVVSEQLRQEPAKEFKGPPPPVAMGAMGGKGGGSRPTPKQGKADPLAVVAGNVAVVVPVPVYYRWPSGKSLKELLDPKNGYKLPPDEIKKILNRVAADGPVPPLTLSASENE